MNINKLTFAVALTVGLIASTSTGFSETFTSNSQTSTLAACPLSGCQTPVTPQTATCPSCLKDMNTCDCLPPAVDPCDPCATGAACPCEPDPCDANPCPAMAPCPVPSDPACAVCPQPNTDKKFQQQVYAYPQAIYGNNQVVGERGNGLYLGDSSAMTATMQTGVPVATTCGTPTCGCGCQDGTTTGAASPIPCLDNSLPTHGISVDRNPQNLDGCGCPVQIHTNTSMEALKKSLVPFEVSTPTGAAVPLVSAFEDVPAGFWASCDINKLTENNIIAGYPDRTFKPNLPISRAEMATLIVKGFNLNDKMTCPQKVFKDVPKNFWANKTINKAVANGMMAGYPNDMFRPNEPISRAEAFAILAKGINCPMDDCKANEILSQYCDASSVPDWAKIPVAKALQAGVLTDSPQPNVIAPNKDASRAEIASMLESVRVALGYSSVDKVSTDDCGCTGAAAFMEKEEIVKIPTLQLNFQDEISAKSAHIGDRFAAKTLDEVTIDGTCFPAGSTVRGKVLEVVRPTKNCQGALRLSFDTIQHEKCKAALPNQILTAQVNKIKKPNAFARIIEFPFTWTGGLLGNIGRTVGGAIVSASNAVDNTLNGIGVGTGEIFQGQFKAAGRSYGDVVKQIVTAPVDVTRTALSGTMGLFQYTGDEISYLVDPNGMKVSSVNPREKVTIAFGCHTQK